MWTPNSVSSVSVPLDRDDGTLPQVGTCTGWRGRGVSAYKAPDQALGGDQGARGGVTVYPVQPADDRVCRDLQALAHAGCGVASYTGRIPAEERSEFRPGWYWAGTCVARHGQPACGVRHRRHWDALVRSTRAQKSVFCCFGPRCLSASRRNACMYSHVLHVLVPPQLGDASKQEKGEPWTCGRWGRRRASWCRGGQS